MDQLIEDMLLLSKVGRRTLSPEPCDLTAMAEKVFQKLSTEEKGREITFQVAQRVDVVADANLMEILLTNLISNAVKFSREKLTAMVEFGCEQQNGQNVIFVRDNGVGFDPQDFNQPDAGGGWGLLSITERAEAAGGKCWVVSSPNQGTQVIVEIPR